MGDTMLTLRSRLVPGNPQLSYSVQPMGYHFWPPLVEQNKLDFPTDVQKDQHPIYLYGRDGDTYAVPAEVWDMHGETDGLKQENADAMSRRYSLVGSWSNWSRFHDLWRDGRVGRTFRAELFVPMGRPIEFQMVCDRDWSRRVFPTPEGSIELGTSSDAHGKNWRLQAPPVNPQLEDDVVMHVEWNPTGRRQLTWTFGEPIMQALSRSYSLAGSWNGWRAFTDLVRDEDLGEAVFVAAVEVPAGQDIEFQVICNRDWSQRIFPALRGSDILGPGGEISGHGRNWRLPAPAMPGMLHLRFDPTGRRSLKCYVVQDAADVVEEVSLEQQSVTSSLE